MSLLKLNKYLSKPDEPLEGNRKLVPVLFSDSKGRYLEGQIRPGISQQIKFWNVSGRTTADGMKWLQDNLPVKVGHLDNISLYVWLGTCDLTTYDRETRYLTLKSNPEEVINSSIQNLKEIATTIGPYSDCKVTFIEIPPFSIFLWNQKQHHPDINQFRNQDSILARNINSLNQKIRELNNNLGVHSPSLTVDISHRQDKTTKNRHHREADKYNYSFYLDGIHPTVILSRVWLKKLGRQMQRDCY